MSVNTTLLRILTGSKCSLSIVICSMVGCFIFIHFCPFFSQKDNGDIRFLNHLPLTRELEKIEEENFQLHVPSKRSPRSLKRKGGKLSLMDELRDDSSHIRLLFFPDHRTAIGPTRNMGNDSLYFYPGRLWLDTDGNPIQAHGGGIMYDERMETYYWYGENKDGETYRSHKKATSRVDIIGVNCYSSKDLWTWKNEGTVLQGEEMNMTHDLYKWNVLERPKVIYNDKTKTYVMWMHVDNSNYSKASIGIAISNSPVGPFKYLYSKRPHGFDSRDMTLFKDDDEKAYLIYSSEDNSVLHIGPLTDDYLDVTAEMTRTLLGQYREAPAVFKYQKTYYMITSGCSSWAPNKALVHVSESIMGSWDTIGNPSIGGNRAFRSVTFFSQGTFVVPLPGLPGSFIFMADRWNPANLRDSRYVWLPLTIGGGVDGPLRYNIRFPFWSRVSIYWHKRWRLPEGWKNI